MSRTNIEAVRNNEHMLVRCDISEPLPVSLLLNFGYFKAYISDTLGGGLTPKFFKKQKMLFFQKLRYFNHDPTTRKDATY